MLKAFSVRPEQKLPAMNTAVAKDLTVHKADCPVVNNLPGFSCKVDWYENRHLLHSGMIFSTTEGTLVRRVRPVAGDGTKWVADDWFNCWCCWDSQIEPCDLVDKVADPVLLKKAASS